MFMSGVARVAAEKTQSSVRAIKLFSNLPWFYFRVIIPGLQKLPMSCWKKLRYSTLEIIPVGYILTDG